MPWFKVDDGLADHPKTVLAGNAAMGLWVKAGAWSAKHLTDGFVPSHMVQVLGTKGQASTLVACGLWSASPDGFQFGDWSEYQPSKESVEAERLAARERMANVRAARKGVRANNTRSSEEVRLTRPVPSQPDPLTTTTGALKRGTRIPDPFNLTPEMRQWAATEAPGADITRETVKFVNYWRSKTRDATKLDWPATWRNWLLNADERKPAQKLTPSQRAQQTMNLGIELKGIEA